MAESWASSEEDHLEAAFYKAAAQSFSYIRLVSSDCRGTKVGLNSSTWYEVDSGMLVSLSRRATK